MFHCAVCSDEYNLLTLRLEEAVTHGKAFRLVGKRQPYSPSPRLQLQSGSLIMKFNNSSICFNLIVTEIQR